MGHIHEKIDVTVSVFVVHEDRVLIRLHEKYHRWLAVGGHVELDEDTNAAAIREVKEEVGLDIELLPPPHVTTEDLNLSGTVYRELIPPLYMNIHSISDTHQHLDLVFAARSMSSNVIPENSDDKWMWLTEEELQAHTDIAPTVRRSALMALKLARK